MEEAVEDCFAVIFVEHMSCFQGDVNPVATREFEDVSFPPRVDAMLDKAVAELFAKWLQVPPRLRADDERNVVGQVERCQTLDDVCFVVTQNRRRAAHTRDVVETVDDDDNTMVGVCCRFQVVVKRIQSRCEPLRWRQTT